MLPDRARVGSRAKAGCGGEYIDGSGGIGGMALAATATELAGQRDARSQRGSHE
jgi:hypothetical protein